VHAEWGEGGWGREGCRFKGNEKRLEIHERQNNGENEDEIKESGDF
jgi:hypothetical protein